MTPTELVQAFIAARFAREPDRDDVASYLTDDFEYVVPRSFGAPLKRAAALDALVGMNTTLFDPSTFRYEEKRVLADGGVVVVEHSVRATTVDGRDYYNDFCWLYEVRDGKIARAIQYADTLQARRGLGDVQDTILHDPKSTTTASVGLDGVLACSTAICSIDAERCELRYRGYDVRDLVGRVPFADVTQLLWRGRWPTDGERAHFDADSRARLVLPAATCTMLDSVPAGAHPLAVLRTAISIEGVLDVSAEDQSVNALHDRALTAYARTATVVAALTRRAAGAGVPEPRDDLPRGDNLLWMATGADPTPLAVGALDALLITYTEHELNASTFASRIVAGTRSDYWSAITAAIGAFKGPHHGGAFEGPINLLLDLGSPAAVPPFVDRALADRTYVPGFGQHHVYRGGDPRVAGMARYAALLADDRGGDELVETAHELARVMAERGGPAPSADLYGGLVMHLLGFPPAMFPAVLVASRIAGWSAHVFEQLTDDAVLRPRASYVGPDPRSLEPA